jgi:outer membrane protein TolC
MQTRRKRFQLLLACAVGVSGCAIGGCTPEAYRRDADREVARILRERKQTALGYEPPVKVSDAPAPRAAKLDYKKIPVTAVPPVAPPAIVRGRIGEVPFGPLGPEVEPVPLRTGYQPGRLGDTSEDADELVFNRAAGPPAPGRGVRRFDLFASLKFATQNSRDYQDRAEDLYLSALDVTLERHLFAPRPFARIGTEYTGGQADVDYRSALAATASAGVRQQLPYGGEIVAETLVRFVNAIEGEVEDGESADIVLSGSLPLLRGAGLINLEPLISQERELVYQVRNFEAYRRSFAVEIATQYFDLRTRQQAINNRLQNYATLEALLIRAQALYETQRLPALEVQRAEQSLLSGENSLITARQAYANALDNFKIALGMNVNDPLDVVPVDLDVPVPEVQRATGVEAAYRYRLELQTAEDRVSDAVRTVEVARNGLLPDLNLTGRTSTGNRTGSPARQLDSRTLEYSAGLQLDLPVDRVAERNSYRRALIGFDRAQRDYEDLRDRVAAQVRADIRGIRAAQSSLTIQQQSIALAERRLDNASTRLELNIQGADTREVVEAQADLLDAQDSFEQAKAVLQVRVLEYLRDTGTLRVDPEAGELGQALYQDSGRGIRADLGRNVDVNAGGLPR